MDLKFDEVNHTYELNSVRIPSVTQILKYHNVITGHYPAGPYRTRGRNVHRATQALDEGHKVQVGDKIRGYLESYRPIVAKYDFTWTEIEKLAYHPWLLYAGMTDRRGIRKGRPCVADIKTGEGPEGELQLAGYAMIWMPKTFQQVDRYRIRLFEDGSEAKVTQYEDPFAFEAWLGYVNTYKWENRKK